MISQEMGFSNNNINLFNENKNNNNIDYRVSNKTKNKERNSHRGYMRPRVVGASVEENWCSVDVVYLKWNILNDKISCGQIPWGQNTLRSKYLEVKIPWVRKKHDQYAIKEIV